MSLDDDGDFDDGPAAMATLSMHVIDEPVSAVHAAAPKAISNKMQKEVSGGVSF